MDSHSCALLWRQLSGNRLIDYIAVSAGVVNKRWGRPIGYRSFKVHEQYSPTAKMHDVAVIELARDLQFDANISPICMPYQFKGQTELGGKVYGSGWGHTTENGASPDNMMKVELDLISNSECKSRWMYRKHVDSTQCCTYTRGKDTCQGDSGGSIDGLVGGKFYAIGIVSYGAGCARQFPGMYARISEYLPWIESNTGERNFCKA